MSECVVDASVLLLALTVRTIDAADARTRLTRSICHAPHLVDAELGNVLRRLVARGSITAAHGGTALELSVDIVDVRHGHTGAVAQLAWKLRNNLTFYNALYVSLASHLNVPLLTADRRLCRTPALPCSVELL